jgi:hypothetical protein
MSDKFTAIRKVMQRLKTRQPIGSKALDELSALLAENKRMREALELLIVTADNAGYDHNIGIMDDAISSARAAIKEQQP